MTVVMTIDIGIKHLAFCVMRKNLGKYDLLLWEVYNTLQPDESTNVCCGKFKNGKKCTRKSAMKNGLYLSGTQNKYYCKTHSVSGCIPVKSNQKVKGMSFTQIALGVLYCIENLMINHSEIMNSISKIGIELQLTKNPQMKFVSHCVLTKLIDLYREKECIPKISFMRASLKLKIKYTGPEIKYTVKNAYSRRKRCAIEYTQYFLNNLDFETEWITKFKNHPMKKCDLSDTFLMALLLLGYPRRK